MAEIVVKQVSPYVLRWNICARLLSMQSRDYRSKTGADGKIINLNVGDSSGDEISVKLWTEAVTLFGQISKQVKVFEFENGQVSVANKRYTTCAHHYEITLGTDSKVTQIDETSVQKIGRKFNQIPGGIKVIRTSTKDLPYRIDLMGIITDMRSTAKIAMRDGREPSIVTIMIVNDTQHCISLAIWSATGREAEEKRSKVSTDIVSTDIVSTDIVGIRGVTVSEANRGTGRRGTVPDREYSEISIKIFRERIMLL